MWEKVNNTYRFHSFCLTEIFRTVTKIQAVMNKSHKGQSTNNFCHA